MYGKKIAEQRASGAVPFCRQTAILSPSSVPYSHPRSIAPAMLLRSRLSSKRVLVPPVHRQLPFLLENRSCCLACFVFLGCCFSQWLSISLSEVVGYQILPQAFSLQVGCDLKRHVTLNPKLYLLLCVQARKAVLWALCSASP